MRGIPMTTARCQQSLKLDLTTFLLIVVGCVGRTFTPFLSYLTNDDDYDDDNEYIIRILYYYYCYNNNYQY